MVRVTRAEAREPQKEHEITREQARRVKRQRTRPLPTAADLWVNHLPGLPSDARLSLFAGNLPATSPTAVPSDSDSDAHLYFLLARNKHIPKRERLVIWLNGGPGCSSFDGALIELGPVRVNEDGTLRIVEGTAWNEYANVLFLDQPAGTGYSYVTKNDNVHELDGAAGHVVTFLANFYKIFAEFATMDTYIAGESYAGQYIPYIADAIGKTTTINTPIKGLLIGAGWISPREQYPAYLTYLEMNGLVNRQSAAYRNLKGTVDRCKQKLSSLEQDNGGKGMVLVNECEQILGAMSAATSKDGKCLNSYDTREYIPCGQEWPSDIPRITQYLRRPDVIKALHAEEGARGKEWVQCSGVVGSHFWTPKSVPSVYLLPQLLEKMPILLFNGDKDLMCAGIGVERMIENLEWNGNTGFNGSEPLDWFVDGESAGRWTTARNLTYVEVFDSSHMVPMDKPAASHDMLLRFLQVDTMHSAGSAAVIPSRIGPEVETVLGATHPNGTSLVDLLNLASGGAGTEKGAEPDGTGGGIVIGTIGDDIEHERKYGPRKTAALVGLLVLLGAAVWALLHVRKRQRRERYRRLKGKGRAARHLEEEETDLSEPETRLRSRDPIPSIAVFDVGEYEEQEDRSDDDEERYGHERRGVRFSEDRAERAGDIGRAADDANPYREDQQRQYERSFRS